MKPLWKVLDDLEFKRKGERILEPYLAELDAWTGPGVFPLPEDIYRHLERLSLIHPTVEHRGMCLGYQNARGFFKFKIEGAGMTDYKGIMNDDDYDYVPQPLSLPAGTKPRRCSTSNHFGSFLTHLQALRSTLKAAEKDGFCLDELINALPDFERAVSQSK